MPIKTMFSVCCIVLMGCTGRVAAEMPKEVKGAWILDAVATEQKIRQSPELKAEDEKYLPAILKRMSSVTYTFTDDQFIVGMRGKEQVMPITLKDQTDQTYRFDSKAGDQDVILTVEFVGDGVISVRSSATDDMDNYLWKRAETP